jgi:hypothetical protein
VYRIGRVPRTLWPIGERLEPRFGKLGRDYRQIVFDKALLAGDATSEWVTPGHPLLETVREEVLSRVRDDLQRGAVFYDLHRPEPCRLDVFSAAIKDGLGNALHRRLFVVQCDLDGTLTIRQPTIFLDLALAPKGTTVPDGEGLADRQVTEHALIEQALGSFLAEDRVDELVGRLERRREELQQERQCTIGEIQHVSRARHHPHGARCAGGAHRGRDRDDL